MCNHIGTNLYEEKNRLKQIYDEDSESKHSQIYDEDPTETENMPSDLKWWMHLNTVINRITLNSD